MLGKRALAGPDSSAVAAVEVAVATAAGAILRAGRGWGAETGGGEAAGRIQSCGAGGVSAWPRKGSAEGSVPQERWVVPACHWDGWTTEAPRRALGSFGCMCTGFVIQV